MSRDFGASQQAGAAAREHIGGDRAAVLVLSAEADRIIDVNAEAERLLGESREALRSHCPSRLLVGDPPDSSWPLGADTVTLRTPGGTARTCRTMSGLIKLGSETRVLVTLSPHPETKRETGLDALLRIAIENLSASFIIYDVNDRLLYFNRTFREMFPHIPPLAEMIGCHFFELIQHSMDTPDVIRDPLCRGDPDAYRRKRLQRLHNPPAEPFEQETGGRWHLVHEQRVPGVGFVSVRRDITAAKRLQTEVAQRVSLFRTLLDTAPVALMLIRISDGRAVMVNQRAAALFGLSEADMIDRPAAAYYGDPEDLEGMLQIVERDEAFHDLEVAFCRADGGTFWGLTSGSWADFESEPVLLLGIVDISARRRYETDIEEANHRLEGLAQDLDLARHEADTARQEAEHANRSKSEFLAMMSHELRTPLNAILGFSSILDQQLFGPLGTAKYAEYARLIHDSGSHLLAIINDILDLAKVEAGKMEIEPDWLEPGELARECATLVRGMSEKRNIHVAIQADCGPRKLYADRRMAKQMIVNLLSNACKFAPENSTVLLACACVGGGAATLTVTDSGNGMSDKQIAAALEPFKQVDSVATNAQSGTGLGLPLVKRFIEMHGGRLGIDSTPGEGTRVSLHFPGAEGL